MKASSPIFAMLRAAHEAAERRRLVESMWASLALLDRLARDEEVRQLELVEDDFVPASGGGRVPLIDEDPPEDGEVAALRHRLACIREALQHDDVDAAKLLASEAPAGAEGPHGAGPAGASGRGGTSDWWMLAPLPQGRQRHGGGGVFVSDLTDSERAIIGGLVGVGEGCDA